MQQKLQKKQQNVSLLLSKSENALVIKQIHSIKQTNFRHQQQNRPWVLGTPNAPKDNSKCQNMILKETMPRQNFSLKKIHIFWINPKNITMLVKLTAATWPVTGGGNKELWGFWFLLVKPFSQYKKKYNNYSYQKLCNFNQKHSVLRYNHE